MNTRFAITALMIALGITTSSTLLYATPVDQDIDGDGIPDVKEDLNGNSVQDPDETNPYNADSDRGGESDGSEVRSGRDPLNSADDFTADTDGDGWVDGIEQLRGTDAKKTDTDGDGVPDPLDAFPLDGRYAADVDHNGLPDNWEQQTKLNQQIIPQSTVDDLDGDSLNNAQEFAKGTNPLSADTDRDGINDNDEIDHGSNPNESPCLQYAESKHSFSDMLGHWAESFVSVLRGTSILPKKIALVVGYLPPSGNAARALFAPDQPVTRFEFLKMVMLSTCTRLINTTASEHAFADVSNISTLNETADESLRRTVIYTAKHYDAIAGYADGLFRPNAPVNRAEAVKMLLLAAQMNGVQSGATLPFVDVSPSDWFAPYIQTASEREIVSGYGDGFFRPARSITRSEAAKIVERVIRQNPLVNGYVLP